VVEFYISHSSQAGCVVALFLITGLVWKIEFIELCE